MSGFAMVQLLLLSTSIIFYANNQQPPDLLIAIILKFNDSRGPSTNNDISGCVPIILCPITVTSDTFHGVHERKGTDLCISYHR